MRLCNLSIHNYKSLRHISFAPTDMAVLVGPNASGKTNIADAIDFLSEVYTHGLEIAVARKGGYENIAFRKQRRTKSAIEFGVTIHMDGKDLRRLRARAARDAPQPSAIRLTHTFSIGTPTTGIRSDYHVVSESFSMSVAEAKDRPWLHFEEKVRVTRGESNRLKVTTFGQSALADEFERYQKMYREVFAERRASGQELAITALPFRNAFFSELVAAIAGFHVYQISPSASRAPGVPTPNPRLSTTGSNLPALVDWLQRRQPKLWDEVLKGMTDVMPGLTDVTVQYLHTKTLGLFFGESQAGRPWGSDDVSDGTIQTLALLVASVDPRSSLLFVEEPENSVHPWIIRVLASRLRAVSKEKTVIATTHSPILIDLMEPAEVWVVSRSAGATGLQQLTSFDPQIVEQWKSGKFRLSQFLDAGFVPQAVPGGAL